MTGDDIGMQQQGFLWDGGLSRPGRADRRRGRHGHLPLPAPRAGRGAGGSGAAPHINITPQAEAPPAPAAAKLPTAAAAPPPPKAAAPPPPDIETLLAEGLRRHRHDRPGDAGAGELASPTISPGAGRARRRGRRWRRGERRPSSLVGRPGLEAATLGVRGVVSRGSAGEFGVLRRLTMGGFAVGGRGLGVVMQAPPLSKR